MLYKTNLTLNKREQLKAQMDDFATFQWRGHNMFDDFGCFIINDKNGSLKFYNGPGFSNQYAKPQFSKSVNGLLGVDWKQQTIAMKVGLYWFTIADYQKFLDCINPYEINYLTFDYAQDYGYLVKLGKIADSTRYIIGYDNNEPVYYTELDLTWELIGDSCVRSNHSYEYDATYSTNQNVGTYEWTLNPNGDMTQPSLLDTGIIFELPFTFDSETASLELQATYEGGESYNLFDISLKNLVVKPEDPSEPDPDPDPDNPDIPDPDDPDNPDIPDPDDPDTPDTPDPEDPDTPDTPDPEDPTKYTVTWKCDDNIIKTEKVNKGDAATPPIIDNSMLWPRKFVQWDTTDYKNVQKNLVVNASIMSGKKYKLIDVVQKYEYINVLFASNNKYYQTMLFEASTSDSTKVQKIYYQEEDEIGDFKVVYDADTGFVGESDVIYLYEAANHPDENAKIKDLFTISETYTVKWMIDTEVLKTEEVVAGSSVTPPSNPQVDGWTFKKWVPEEFSNISADMTFTASFDLLSTNKFLGLWRLKESPSTSDEGKYSLTLEIDNTTYDNLHISGGSLFVVDESVTPEKFMYLDPSSSSAAYIFKITGGTFLQTSKADSFMKSIAVKPDASGWFMKATHQIITPEQNGLVNKTGYAYDDSGTPFKFEKIYFEDNKIIVQNDTLGEAGSYELYNFETQKLGAFLTFVFNDPQVTESERAFLDSFAMPVSDPEIKDDSTYTVTFVNGLTQEVIEQQTVEAGGSATPPSPNEYLDWTHKFKGWNSEEYKNVNKNLTIVADIEAGVKYQFNDSMTCTFQKIEISFASNYAQYTSIMIDRDTVTNQVGYMTYDGDGGNIVAYDGKFNGECQTIYVFEADSDTNELEKLQALVKAKQYTVEFYDKHGDFISSTEVASGGTAIAPTPPKEYGYEFSGWEPAISNITSDIKTYAKYNQLKSNETQIFTSPADSASMEYLGGKPSDPGLQYYYKYGVVNGNIRLLDVASEDYITNLNTLNLTNAEECYCIKDTKEYHWKVRVKPIGGISHTTEVLLINVQTNDILLVDDNMFIDKSHYLVTFIDYDLSEISTQYVKSGEKVTPPTLTPSWNEHFIGWVSEKGYTTDDVITADTVFKAQVHNGTLYYIDDSKLDGAFGGTTSNCMYKDPNLHVQYLNENGDVVSVSEVYMEWFTDPDTKQTSYVIAMNGDAVYQDGWIIPSAQNISVHDPQGTSFWEFLRRICTVVEPTTMRMMRRVVVAEEEQPTITTANISDNPDMRMTLRYDSETGLAYVQEGTNTWRLLNYQTDNNNGEYILSACKIYKWQIPGLFSAPNLESTKWSFKLTTTNASAETTALNTALTIYARKNIV